MVGNFDQEIQRLKTRIGEDLEYTRDYKKRRWNRAAKPVRTSKSRLSVLVVAILCVAGIVVAMWMLEWFQRNSLIRLDKRLATLEDRIARLEQRLPAETATRAMPQATRSTSATEVPNPPAAPEKPRKLETGGQTLATVQQDVVPPEERVEYHEVQPGDHLFGIAQIYGMELHELCRLNNIGPDHVIHPGDKLLVAPVNR
jgi:LysM repeat protein